MRLADQKTEQFMDAICQGGFIGGLCVSGPGAGQEASMDYLEEVAALAKKRNVPVFCNTGCRHDTIERILKVADGACVGTALKGVDLEKVRTFMELARR